MPQFPSTSELLRDLEQARDRIRELENKLFRLQEIEQTVKTIESNWRLYTHEEVLETLQAALERKP